MLIPLRQEKYGGLRLFGVLFWRGALGACGRIPLWSARRSGIAVLRSRAQSERGHRSESDADCRS